MAHRSRFRALSFNILMAAAGGTIGVRLLTRSVLMMFNALVDHLDRVWS
jgi:hypothetical protein